MVVDGNKDPLGKTRSELNSIIIEVQCMAGIKRLVILMLLFATSSFADISGQRDSLRVMIFDQSLVDTAGTAVATKAVTNRMVNRAIQKVCHDFPAIEKWDTVVSVIGTRHYALNTDFLRLKAVLKSTTIDDLNNLYTLSFPPIETWFEAKGGEAGGKPDPSIKPDPRYAWAFADRLYFYPTPSKAESFVIAYYAMDKDLTGDTMTTAVLPEFREAIVWYGSFLLATRRGDYERATFFSKLYNETIIVATKKEEENKK